MPKDNLSRQDEKFLSELQAATRNNYNKSPYLILIATMLFIVFAIYWANTSEIEIIARGDGKAIPSTDIQIIQNLEGGILDQLSVKEGGFVKKGDLILRIHNQKYISAFKEHLVQKASLEANLHRLYAEQNNEEICGFTSDFMKENSTLVKNQVELFHSRKKQFKKLVEAISIRSNHLRKEILENQIRLTRLRAELLDKKPIFSNPQTTQAQQLIQEELQLYEARRKVYQHRIKAIEANKAITRKELKMSLEIRQKGSISDVEIFRLEGRMASFESSLQEIVARRLQEITSKIENKKSQILVLQRQLSNAISDKINITTEWQKDIADQIAENENALASVSEKARSLEDTVKRTTILAPVDGFVNHIHIRNKGAVIREGEPIAEIIPNDSQLIFEGKISPQDVAYIQTGMPVIVKLSAFDYSTYGSMEGKLIHISPDSHSNDQSPNFYKILVEMKQNYILNEENKIIPGMTAQLDIVTGKRTILDYFLSPIYNDGSNAFSER